MSPPAPPPGDDPIRAWLSSRAKSGATPGGVWWVEGPGGVVSHGAAGLASLLPQRREAGEEIPYDLSSLTKPLCTALLAALLESEGRLSLSAAAAGLLPELSGSAYEGVTLLDLGAHRAGVPAWRPLYAIVSSGLDGYVARIAREPPAVPPGATLYSDLGFILLGAAVSRAAGARLDALFDERIAQPLGLRRCGYASGHRRFDDAAPTEQGNAHERTMAGAAGQDHPWRTAILAGEVHDGNAHGLGGVAGHAGLFGTVREVAAVAREILRPRVLPLDERARQRLLRSVAPDAGRTFGLVLARDSGAARAVLPDAAPGHTGFTGTSVWLDPPRGAIFVLLTNRVHPHVREADFQVERRVFHRLARSLVRG